MIKQDNAQQALNAAYENIRNLQGIRIEKCGNWLWVSGRTLPYVAKLRSIGFRWASKKECWYFCPDKNWQPKGEACSMDEIRSRHQRTVLKENINWRESKTSISCQNFHNNKAKVKPKSMQARITVDRRDSLLSKGDIANLKKMLKFIVRVIT